MKSVPIVAIWLDNRRTKNGNLFPVKIRITHNRKRYYYPTGVNLSEVDFNKAVSNNPGAKFTKVHQHLYSLQKEAIEAIFEIIENKKAHFTIELFEKILKLNDPQYRDVFKCFERKIEKSKLEGRIKTSECCRSAYQSFKEFTGNEALSFYEVDKLFLDNYESFMLANKKSLGTIGAYTRELRTVFNEAIDNQIINGDIYPFGNNKYQIPGVTNIKRALRSHELVKLIEYMADDNYWEQLAKNYFLFSLYCQGMNMKDIANLKYGDIEKDTFSFVREKTKRTKKTGRRIITVYLTEESKKIIALLGNQNRSKDNYVFPILNKQLSPERKEAVVAQHIKMVNKYLRIIGKKIGIENDITTQTARHSFATSLKRRGLSTETIQELIGHADKSTTQFYLDSFEDDYKSYIIKDFVTDLSSK